MSEEKGRQCPLTFTVQREQIVSSVERAQGAAIGRVVISGKCLRSACAWFVDDTCAIPLLTQKPKA